MDKMKSLGIKKYEDREKIRSILVMLKRAEGLGTLVHVDRYTYKITGCKELYFFRMSRTGEVDYIIEW